MVLLPGSIVFEFEDDDLEFLNVKLCYLRLYYRKSMLSFSTLYLKEICTR